MTDILIVEDNYINYMVVKEILSLHEINLQLAADGKEFYEIIKKSTKFDVVLMDLMLPDTDGIILTKYLIENKINIPVIFISAYSGRCKEIFDLGVEYFISKPINKELFFSILSKYVQIKLKE